MSAEARTWAKKQKAGSASQKSVLVAIADYVNEDGYAWPSQARIARDTDLSVRSIIRAIAALEKAGLIQIFRRPPRDDGRRESNLMRLPIEPGDKASLGDISHVTRCPKPSDRLAHKPSVNRQQVSSHGETQVSTGRGYTRGQRRLAAPAMTMPHEDEPF